MEVSSLVVCALKVCQQAVLNCEKVHKNTTERQISVIRFVAMTEYFGASRDVMQPRHVLTQLEIYFGT